MPPHGSGKNRRKKSSSSQSLKSRQGVTSEERRRFLALDCEMVGIGVNGHKSALARVVLLGWEGNVVFDSLVRVAQTVTDYRTHVSGIHDGDLTSDGALDLEECRGRVRDLVKGKILVGHALKNDLRALELRHPWHDIRDTAKYEPFMKVRFDDGVLWPRKLKELAQEKLRRAIQQEGREHCPIEDAKAAFDLYKSVRVKWEKVMDYKVNKTREIQKLQMPDDTPVLPPAQ
eukprot:CAMPEP_0183313976 /NCGR_PEP_ID=MMETSP0160_2-20130417/47091_1 /TAXON_ID=2839 ORGANISM="Odontella Sinensis, Strain Grunow 1884" /NCGR_SAMPLE_ID=MMETSP0160_2 /ASSEMBLY_ACC=CAM_ASM_000250 /LENGTH=230 /DNA_ID=CAMNT_0025479177 /DNA_START=403 /DNA_END=1095 /DNA_ORIENTATION=-